MLFTCQQRLQRCSITGSSSMMSRGLRAESRGVSRPEG
jgi:hypothetical protein